MAIGSIYPMAIGSIYPMAIGSIYPMAIGSIYPKANILTILTHTATRMHFHARFQTSLLKLIETPTDV
jgi:hypothetical protein